MALRLVNNTSKIVSINSPRYAIRFILKQNESKPGLCQEYINRIKNEIEHYGLTVIDDSKADIFADFVEKERAKNDSEIKSTVVEAPIETQDEEVSTVVEAPIETQDEEVKDEVVEAPTETQDEEVKDEVAETPIETQDEEVKDKVVETPKKRRSYRRRVKN